MHIRWRNAKITPGGLTASRKTGRLRMNRSGAIYRGKELSWPVEVYPAAFPDMHRELYRFFVDGDTVIVELALQGVQKGPLELPLGTIQPTGKRMDAPCCDVFRLKNGKIQSFNCYPSGTVIFAQLGVLSNIEAAIAKP